MSGWFDFELKVPRDFALHVCVKRRHDYSIQRRSYRGAGESAAPPIFSLSPLLRNISSAWERAADKTQRKSSFRQLGLEQSLFVSKLGWCTLPKVFVNFSPDFMYATFLTQLVKTIKARAAVVYVETWNIMDLAHISTPASTTLGQMRAYNKDVLVHKLLKQNIRRDNVQLIS